MIEKMQIERYIKAYLKRQSKKPYNKGLLLSYLLDDEVDTYVSISTRGDGKTFTYIPALANISKIINKPLLFIARNDLVVNTVLNNVITVIDRAGLIKDVRKTVVERTSEYIFFRTDKGVCGYVVSLTNTTDLKQMTEILKEVQFIIYDEFIIETEDYSMQESVRLSSLYYSIDRPGVDRTPFTTPKIFLLGNAINFDSPLLAHFQILDLLEDHPINSIKKYPNEHIVMELNENKEANKALSQSYMAKRDTSNYAMNVSFGGNRERVVTKDMLSFFLTDYDIFEVKDRKVVMQVLRKNNKYLISFSNNFSGDYQWITDVRDFKENEKLISFIMVKNLNHLNTILPRIYFKNGYSKEYYYTHYRDINIDALPFISVDKVEMNKNYHNTLDMEQKKERIQKKFYEHHTKTTQYKDDHSSGNGKNI